MARQVASVEPTVISAGDTVKWNRDLNEFNPDDGWILSYAFRGERGDGRLDITAANDNGTHAVTISAASSNLMRAGLWMWAAYATLGTERYQVGSGSTRVNPNLAVTNFNLDLRTPAKVAYDNALDCWQKVKLGQTVVLNGRTYTQHNLKSLIEYVDRCKSDYALEQQYADINVGGDPRHIFVRLKRE